MKEFLTNEKYISILLIGVLLLSILPLFLLGSYNHPCADDFSYGGETAVVWRETGSFSQTLKAAVEKTKDVYQTWQGSFAGVFLMALHPGVFGESLYKMVPLFLILTFAASLFFFCHVLLVTYAKGTKEQSRILASVLILLFMQFVISPVEAYFWYNGSMYYTLFFSLALTHVSCLLLLWKTKRQDRQVIGTLLLSLFGFFIGGGNFVVALTHWVVLGILTGVSFFVEKRRGFLTLFITLATGVGLALSILAPGNSARQDLMVGMSPVSAILSSYTYGFRFLIFYIRIPVYFALLALFPLLYKIAKKSEFSFPLPGLATFLIFSAYAASFTPNLYGMASYGPPRVANVNQYLAILMLVGLAFYWSGWIGRKTAPQPEKKVQKKDPKEDSSSFPFIVFLVVLIATGIGFGLADDPNYMTSTSAVSSLVSGEGKAYHQEYLDRLEVVTQHVGESVVLPPFQHQPHLLFFDDITTDPQDWRNLAFAKFYQLEQVVLAS